MRSTRKLWLFALLLAAPALASAQGARGLSWGITAAVGAASDHGSGIPGTYSRASTLVGAFVEKPVNEMWSIHPELDMVTKGTHYDEKTPPMGDLSGSLALSYLEVPVMLRASRGSDTRVYGEVGPSVAFKTGCTATASQNEGNVPATCHDFGKVKSFDAGGAVGAGVILPSGKSAVMFGARYTMGEMKVIDGTNAKNRELEFSAGITF